jgi:hypothetical protein
VEYLSAGMHTGIGAPATVNANFSAKHPMQAGFDVVLYAVPARLTLPPTEPSAIVFACALPTHGNLGLDSVFLRSLVPVQHEEKCTGSGTQ